MKTNGSGIPRREEINGPELDPPMSGGRRSKGPMVRSPLPLKVFVSYSRSGNSVPIGSVDVPVH